MDDIILNIIEDYNWNEISKPTNFIPFNNTMLIKYSYYNKINKHQPKTYSWIVHEYATYLWHSKIESIHDNKDFLFPNDECSKFSFAYQFDYLKRHGVKDLIDLKDDEYMMKLYLNNKILKTYFLNSSFILSMAKNH